jgi:PAT family beta-lactamase induction signal transducer AmpG
MNEIQAVGVEVAAGQRFLAPDGDQPERQEQSNRPEHPWIYSLLIAPSAVVANGVVQGGVLAYLLSQQGVGSKGQSHLIFLLALPTWLYFLWSPITDFFVKRRTWLIAGAVSAAAFMAIAFHLHNLSSGISEGLMLLSACCTQLVVSSCGGMMGAMSSERAKRASSGFYQAGSMGFGALSISVLIPLSSRVSADKLGLVAAAMIALPALLAFAAPRQETIATGSFGKTMERVWTEFRATFFRWEALPYAACMTFPMASGAAIGLLPGVAQQYGVNGDNVAWINGLLGGALMAAGAVAMGAVRYKMRAGLMYMIVALINCAALAVLWLGPLRPATYMAGTILYLFTVGACYAMFTAVVLEFMGDSGKSGSTRYSIINSLGNVPVVYMLIVDGVGGERWGGRGLAGSECVVGAIGATILLAYFLTLGRNQRHTANT